MLTAGSLWEVRLFIQLFLVIFPSLLYFTGSVQLLFCCYNLFENWNLYQANIECWSDRPVKSKANTGWTIRSSISNTYLCSAAKGARGRFCCCGFFFKRNSLDKVSGVLFLLVYTASRASDKRRIQITHKPNLFHTSRFCKLSGKLLNSDRERYFFMFMKDAGHMLKLNVAGRRRKSHPPSPNSKPRS